MKSFLFKVAQQAPAAHYWKIFNTIFQESWRNTAAHYMYNLLLESRRSWFKSLVTSARLQELEF